MIHHLVRAFRLLNARSAFLAICLPLNWAFNPVRGPCRHCYHTKAALNFLGSDVAQTLTVGSKTSAQHRETYRRSSEVVASISVDVVSGEPLILAIDGLCNSNRTRELRKLFEEHEKSDLTQTNAYVDDMFEEQKTLQEDAHLLHCLAKVGVPVPEEYRDDPLRSFLWAAAQPAATALAPEDVAQARSGMARRAWQLQWDPQQLARSGFKKAAKRWKVPESMLRCLAPLVVNILGTGADGLAGSQHLCSSAVKDMKWVLRDSTVVQYRSGESQVPHLDTCDMTVLVYLSDCGGSTCFPNLNLRVQPRAGRVLVFFSTVLESERFGGFADAAYGSPNDATMHYGGLASGSDDEGAKMVVQLLLSADDIGSAMSWRDALRGKAFQQCFFSPGWHRLHLDVSMAKNNDHADPVLALRPQSCAAGCRALSLDFEIQPGSPTYCVHCWMKWLQDTIEPSLHHI